MHIMLLDIITVDNGQSLISLFIPPLAGILINLILRGHFPKWQIPWGLPGVIISGLLGIVGLWLMTTVISLSGMGDVYLLSVPLIRLILGTIIALIVVHYCILLIRSAQHKNVHQVQNPQYPPQPMPQPPMW